MWTLECGLYHPFRRLFLILGGIPGGTLQLYQGSGFLSATHARHREQLHRTGLGCAHQAMAHEPCSMYQACTLHPDRARRDGDGAESDCEGRYGEDWIREPRP